MNKEYGAQFSTEMMQAILAGRKRMTRRTRGLEVINKRPDDWYLVRIQYGEVLFANNMTLLSVIIPWQVGDRLRVREAWAVDKVFDFFKPSELPEGIAIWYATEPRPAWVGRTRSSMFMPKWASRKWLTVTGVKAERLQNISYKDILAEGWDLTTASAADVFDKGFIPYHEAARAWYYALWDRVSPKLPVSVNPWDFGYSFEVEK